MSRKIGKMLFPLLCLLLSVLIASPVHAQPDPLQGLDAYIRQSMATWQVPGLAIAIVKDDKVVFIKGYGIRETGKPAPVDENTVFPLSSLTKAFTAAAVGILVDEGKLSWDDPVVKHLPWFQLPDPWVTRRVTLRDMLAHRVGGDLGNTWISIATTTDHRELLRRLRYLEAVEPRFRSRFSYRNISFLALGEVVEAVSGMSWEDFVRMRILEPLGMQSATTSNRELWDPESLQPCWLCEPPSPSVGFEDARVQNIVLTHVLSEAGLRPIPWIGLGSHPAGSISAHLNDVAKWIRMQLAEGVYEGKRIVSAQSIEEMRTPQIPIQYDLYPLGPESGHFWAYGLGWFLTDYRGRKVIMHGGDFHTFIAMMPEENLGVAVLTNLTYRGRGRRNHLRVALPFWIFDAYLGAPKRDWSADLVAKAKTDAAQGEARMQKLEAQRVKGTHPSLPLEKYVGVYAHPVFGEVKISKDEGNLVVRIADGAAGDLMHWHYDLFELKWKQVWRNPAQIGEFVVFTLGPTGEVGGLRIEFPPGGTGTTFTRTPSRPNVGE
jgi:CubicO group peptidase (beta-lactamase class C family)